MPTFNPAIGRPSTVDPIVMYLAIPFDESANRCRESVIAMYPWYAPRGRAPNGTERKSLSAKLFWYMFVSVSSQIHEQHRVLDTVANRLRVRSAKFKNSTARTRVWLHQGSALCSFHMVFRCGMREVEGDWWMSSNRAVIVKSSSLHSTCSLVTLTGERLWGIKRRLFERANESSDWFVLTREIIQFPLSFQWFRSFFEEKRVENEISVMGKYTYVIRVIRNTGRSSFIHQVKEYEKRWCTNFSRSNSMTS